jgi:hypothetical protein
MIVNINPIYLFSSHQPALATKREGSHAHLIKGKVGAATRASRAVTSLA